ncbi:neutral zinc metallopeptidase [Streptomyces sp. NPDC005722]
MQFDDDASLDTSQVEDQRSGGRFGGRPRGKAVGGGLIGLIVVVIGLIFGISPDQLGLSSDPPRQAPGTTSGSDLAEGCRTGADANARQECRMVAVINNVQAYWSSEFRKRGMTYEPAPTVFFDQPIRTGCGVADPASGPFYCPVDRKVYLDLDFFSTLTSRFGAEGGPFAESYVVAHEYGHHVQDLVGTLGKAQDRLTGPSSNSVRVELQADCYAGVWAHNATRTLDEDTGSPMISALDEDDIRRGLDAAAAVGDDAIQSRVQGRVTPESWTHGSSAQRQQWFTTGLDSGDPGDCDTFAR